MVKRLHAYMYTYTRTHTRAYTHTRTHVHTHTHTHTCTVSSHPPDINRLGSVGWYLSENTLLACPSITCVLMLIITWQSTMRSIHNHCITMNASTRRSQGIQAIVTLHFGWIQSHAITECQNRMWSVPKYLSSSTLIVTVTTYYTVWWFWIAKIWDISSFNFYLTTQCNRSQKCHVMYTLMYNISWR